MKTKITVPSHAHPRSPIISDIRMKQQNEENNSNMGPVDDVHNDGDAQNIKEEVVQHSQTTRTREKKNHHG